MSQDRKTKLDVSLFFSEKDNVPAASESSWDELLLDSLERPSKAGSPCWSPATFDGSRSIQHVVELSCLVFDLDQEMTDELANTLGTLDYIAHTTHTPGRWRIIVRTTRPHLPAEHKKLWKYVDDLCGNVFDEKCTDVSRIYYRPSHRPGVSAERHTNPEGKPLDVDAVLGIACKPESRQEAPVIDLEAYRAKAKTLVNDEKRELLENLLSCEWGPEDGNRSVGGHNALSLLATVCQPTETEALAMIECMLMNMHTEPEGEEHWRQNFISSFERGVEYVKNRKAAIETAKALIETKAVEAGEAPNWRATLQQKSNEGEPPAYKSNGSNLNIILRNHTDFKTLRFNVVSREVECPEGPLAGSSFDDIDVCLSNWLARSEFRMAVSRDECLAQIKSVVRGNPYDPLKAYLDTVKWDGTPRISSVLKERCNATGSDFYVSKVSRMFFISAAARGLQPGTQVDTMLILVGEGGAGKTRFVRALGGEFAAETTLDIHNKDGLMGITGKWLVEQAEMSAMKRSEEEAFRAFITRLSDDFRPPYGRVIQHYPRRCVFVGTSNVPPLNDVDGVRRYWPLNVGKIDVKWLADNRDQLWAEAVAAVKAGEVHYFTDEERQLVEPEVNMFQQSDLPAEMVRDWFQKMHKADRPAEVSMRQVLSGAFLLSGVDSLNGRHHSQVAKALKLMGFVKKRRSTGGREWYYVTPEELLTGEIKRPMQLVKPPTVPAEKESV